MSSNPLNLALRFLLEVLGLLALGYWGWNKAEGIFRYLLALGIPIIAAAIWGTFRVPNDPGKAPVRVPGILRLVIEIAFSESRIVLKRIDRDRHDCSKGLFNGAAQKGDEASQTKPLHMQAKWAIANHPCTGAA
jgi:hypothetical protein